MNSEGTVKVELSKEFADTLSTIKNFVEESKKKTEENFTMFSDFESMMTNRQERGAFHEKEMRPFYVTDYKRICKISIHITE